MNKDEFEGGARYIGGKVQKAVGDGVNSRDWQVGGVVDQVAGSAQHAYGRARSVAEDVIDSAPALAEDVVERLQVAGDRAVRSARKHGTAAAHEVQDNPALWALGAAIAGYALGWLVHARRS